MADNAKSKLQIWKADISNKQKAAEKGLKAVVPQLKKNLAAKKPPATIERIEQISLYSLRAKTFENVLNKINLVFSEIPLIFSNKVSPETMAAVEYLKSVALSDTQKISKDSIEPISKKVKVNAKPDHEAAICFGAAKMDPADVVKYACEVANDCGDSDNAILNVLLKSPKYKAEVQKVLEAMPKKIEPQANVVYVGYPMSGMPQQYGMGTQPQQPFMAPQGMPMQQPSMMMQTPPGMMMTPPGMPDMMMQTPQQPNMMVQPVTPDMMVQQDTMAHVMPPPQVPSYPDVAVNDEKEEMPFDPTDVPLDPELFKSVKASVSGIYKD